MNRPPSLFTTSLVWCRVRCLTPLLVAGLACSSADDPKPPLDIALRLTPSPSPGQTSVVVGVTVTQSGSPVEGARVLIRVDYGTLNQDEGSTGSDGVMLDGIQWAIPDGQGGYARLTAIALYTGHQRSEKTDSIPIP
jgi:hypothetical protein